MFIECKTFCIKQSICTTDAIYAFFCSTRKSFYFQNQQYHAFELESYGRHLKYHTIFESFFNVWIFHSCEEGSQR